MTARAMPLIAAMMVILATSCTVEMSDGLLGSAYVGEPTTDLPGREICAAFGSLPEGEPLAGVAVGAQREATVQDAMAGRPVNGDDLTAAYAELLTSIDLYATAFERASSLLDPLWNSNDGQMKY
jgi:hypothetical protein